MKSTNRKSNSGLIRRAGISALALAATLAMAPVRAAPPEASGPDVESAAPESQAPEAMVDPAPAPPQPTAAAQAVETAPVDAPRRVGLWIVAAVLLLGVAVLLWRRRKRSGAKAAAAPERTLRRVPGAPPPVEAPKEEAGLVIALEAQRMTGSPKGMALSYSLTLTNRGAQPLSALAIEADMVAANPSTPIVQQVASRSDQLVLRNALVELAAGASTTLTGDIHLPFAKITPIVGDNAPSFVPLARVRVEAAVPGGASLVEARTYVIGDASDIGGSLRPFPMEGEARVYEQVSQRALN